VSNNCNIILFLGGGGRKTGMRTTLTAGGRGEIYFRTSQLVARRVHGGCGLQW